MGKHLSFGEIRNWALLVPIAKRIFSVLGLEVTQVSEEEEEGEKEEEEEATEGKGGKGGLGRRRGLSWMKLYKRIGKS